jgi:SAM-dependent methyltransferase
VTFDEERLVPEEAVEASLQEHLARYRFAKERARGRILDVACGTGYGTAMLDAVGVDLALEALRYARRHPARYVAADAARLPFGRVFDTVVSFETIEHVADPARFVAECGRVLKPGGLFVVSTPNRELWSPRSARPLQRHHVKEFTRKEFLELLRPFKVQLFGQILLTRRGAALWEGKELAKRVVRALLPVRRFRRSARRRLGELEPDPKYAVLPCGSRTPAIFVALAQRP